MSQSANPTESTLAQGPGRSYQLSDELARLCLPAEYRDAYRTLAWVNSICFLFLLVGLVGFKAPRVIQRPLAEIAEVVPVDLPAPDDQPKPQPEVQQDEPQPEETQIETPHVAVVAAAADPSQVAFSVPVVGAISVKEVRFATPPPPAGYAPPKPVNFDPNAASGGNYPPPDYPTAAKLSKHQGTVTLEIAVDAAGNVTSVKLVKSSGFPTLDDAAIRRVKGQWRFPSGQERLYHWDCTFELK